MIEEQIMTQESLIKVTTNNSMQENISQYNETVTVDIVSKNTFP